MRATIVSSLILLLSLSTLATLALPSGSFSPSSPVLMAPALVRPRAASSPLSSPNANAAGPRPRNAFKAPRRVPMPFVRPREVEIQLGELDEDLEGCSERNIHDCYVDHELERVKERRAEQTIGESLRVIKRTHQEKLSGSATANRMQVRRR